MVTAYSQKVNAGGALYSGDVDSRYKALHCKIECLQKISRNFTEISQLVSSNTIVVKNIYIVSRDLEYDSFK